MVEGDVLAVLSLCRVSFGKLTCINITFVDYVSNQSDKFYKIPFLNLPSEYAYGSVMAVHSA